MSYVLTVISNGATVTESEGAEHPAECECDHCYGRAANGTNGVGAGYDCTVQRASPSEATVTLTRVSDRQRYAWTETVESETDLQALAVRYASSPEYWMFEGTEVDA